MKLISVKNVLYRKVNLAVFLGVLIMTVSSCERQKDFKYVEANTSGKTGGTAWEFIQGHESFSVLKEAIERAQLKDRYSREAPATFILPTNGAFKSYLSSNNYSSILEIPIPILRNVLLYHIIDKKILTADTSLVKGDIPKSFETENGQQMYLSHNNNYQLVINATTSKSWVIEVSNIEPVNGAIHVSPSVVYYSAKIADSKEENTEMTADTLSAIQDAYILGGTGQNQNFGTEKLIKVKNVDGKGPYDRRGFLMFDLNEISAGGNLREALIEVGISFTHGKGVDLYLFNVPDTSWSENSLTWANAPSGDPEPIAKITSSKVASFKWNVTGYIANKLSVGGRISIKIDAEPGSDETDEFYSHRSDKGPGPRLILTFSSGISNLKMGTNRGLDVSNGGVRVLNESMLEMEGAAPADMIYKIESLPQQGWLIRGADILKVGSEFTQLDINAHNIVYVHNGMSTSEDQFTLSVRDPDGGKIDPFAFHIRIQ